jgi:branched-chain amino acid transport system substrate-binding protein
MRNVPLLFSAAAALGFGGWLLAATITPPEPSKAVSIGVILSTSGSADYIGKPEKAVLEALKQQWVQSPLSAGRAIELKYSDSGTKPAQALTLFRQYATDQSVIAIIGPSTSPESIPIARETDTYSDGDPPVVLSLAASREIVFSSESESNNSPRPRKWVFKFAQNDDLAAKRLVAEIIRRNSRKLALLYQNDAFGASGAEVFREAVRSRGELTLVHDVAFDAGLTRPEPVVASVPENVDAVIIWGTKPGPEQLVKEFRARGRTSQIYLSHGNASSEIIRATGTASEGVIVVGSRVLIRPENLNANRPGDMVILEFRGLWKKQNIPGEPSHFAGHARDAFDLLRKTLTEDQQIKTRSDLRAALERRVSPYVGVTGTFNFSPSDHAGLTEEAFETYIIHNGEFVPVEAGR